MRRRAQIAGAAGAVVGFGFVLWALASTNLPERFNQMFFSSTPSTREATPSVARPAESASRSDAEVAAKRGAEVLAIEIARIDAGGASVLAGRSPPNHRVTVLANGREIATVVASDEGQWSAIVTEGIAAGSLELKLSSQPQGGGTAVVSTPRQLTVPASSSPTIAAALPSASAPAPVKAVPSPGKSGEVAQNSKGGEASDKRALADFEALVARTRSEMNSGNAKDKSAISAAPSSSSAVATTAPSSSAAGSAADMSSARPAAPKTAAVAPVSGAAAKAATDAMPDQAQVPIPVPITFMTDDTTLTADGARAAALLAEYLRLKRPEAISLSGHADSRGPHSYNMDLSRQRLEVIERYLRAAGYTGQLSLLARGKSEPYRGVDRRRLSIEEIYQADRRVELRITP